MEKSTTIGELAKALAAAQAEIENAKKDSVNPFFKAKYADLASIREACKIPLSKHGLAIVQMPKSIITEEATIVSIETILMHSSGEWVSGDFSAIPVKNDPQGIGSCLTYLRRYALSAATGVAAEDDDDGNAASQGNTQPAKRTEKPKDMPNPLQPLRDGVAEAFKTLNQLGHVPAWTKKSMNEYIALHFQGAANLEQLDATQINELLRMLSEKIDSFKNGDSKRENIMAAIGASFDSDKHRDVYLEEKYPGRTLEQLTIAELETVEKDVSLPF